jgi:hypothetical protein
LKGEVSLLGADVIIIDGNMLNIILRGKKGPCVQLKAKTNKEVILFPFTICYSIVPD